MWLASLGKLAVFLARVLHHRGKAEVSFNAAWLVINSVFLVALPGELLLDGPRTRPHCRIFDSDDVFQRARGGPRPALDKMQVLARAPIIGLRTEVRHVDHERIALPVAARVAIPLADAGRQMRAAVHDDASLPSLALTHVVGNRDAPRCLPAPSAAAAAVPAS